MERRILAHSTLAALLACAVGRAGATSDAWLEFAGNAQGTRATAAQAASSGWLTSLSSPLLWKNPTGGRVVGSAAISGGDKSTSSTFIGSEDGSVYSFWTYNGGWRGVP